MKSNLNLILFMARKSPRIAQAILCFTVPRMHATGIFLKKTTYLFYFCGNFHARNTKHESAQQCCILCACFLFPKLAVFEHGPLHGQCRSLSTHFCKLFDAHGFYCLLLKLCSPFGRTCRYEGRTVLAGKDGNGLQMSMG